MANEVYVSAQGDTLQTNVLRRELELLLHQRPFMRRLTSYRGSTRMSGASIVKVGQVDPDDVAEGVNEGSGVSANTAITDSSYTLTPGRQAIKRILSDLLAGIDSTGLMRELALANWNFTAIMKRFDALFATAIASLTGTVGTSGGPMIVDDYYTALQTLRTRRVRGKKAMMLHPHQFNHFQSDMRGETGPLMHWQPSAAVATSTLGDDYQGELGDISVWTSDQVADADAGANHGGGMFQIPSDSDPNADGFYLGDAAIAFATGSPAEQTLGNQRVYAADGLVYTDIQGDADKAEAMVVTNAFFSVGVALAGRGIKINTDHA